MKRDPNTRRALTNLLSEALETEIGAVEIYRMAILCATSPQLKEEWLKSLAQTMRREEILRAIFVTFGLDPATTRSRQIIREETAALRADMERAMAETPASAEDVAAECVSEVVAKGHMNWESIGTITDELSGDERKVLVHARAEVEDETEERFIHATGWSHDLSVVAIGPARSVLKAARAQLQQRTARIQRRA